MDPFINEQMIAEKMTVLDQLADRLYLLGFGAPFTPYAELKATPEFQELQQALADADDPISSQAKVDMKISNRVLSLSADYLRKGQGDAQALLRAIHGHYKTLGLEAPLDMVALAFTVKEIDRQAGTISTFTPPLPYSEEVLAARKAHGLPDETTFTMPGFMKLLPDISERDGFSGETAELLDQTLTSLHDQLQGLAIDPKGELLFERATASARQL